MCAAKVMGLFIKCFNPESNHVVYRPDGSRHLCDPDMNRGLDQRPQVRVQPLHPNEEVANYPPHIQRTLDGEEGYSECQRYLQSPWDSTACRPPPNRTIYDGESPPPYRSQSVSHIGRPGQNTKAAASRIIRDPSGNPTCFSMSSNNNNTRNSNLNDAPPRHHHHHHHQQQQQQQQPHQAHTPAGGAALPGSYPHHNLTVYGHPPRTCLGPIHLQQELSLEQQSHLHRLQQQQHAQQQQHQQQQQQHSQAGIASHPTINRHGGGHPEAIAPTPALGPPPNYSDVVNATNYDVFTTSHPDSDV